MIPEQMAFFAAIAFVTFSMAAYQVKGTLLRTRRMAERAEDFQRASAEKIETLERMQREMGPGPSYAPRARPAPYTGARSIPRCDYCNAAREPGKTSCHGCGAPAEEMLPPLLTMNPMIELYDKGLVSRRTVLEELGIDNFGATEKLS